MTDDTISRQAAIDALRTHERKPSKKWFDNQLDIEWNNAIDICCYDIEDLPSAQPETADCIYCHEDSDGYVKPIEKNCHAFIRFGMNGWEISLSAKGWNGSAKIMYCPMCGRRLSE